MCKPVIFQVSLTLSLLTPLYIYRHIYFLKKRQSSEIFAASAVSTADSACLSSCDNLSQLKDAINRAQSGEELFIIDLRRWVCISESPEHWPGIKPPRAFN